MALFSVIDDNNYWADFDYEPEEGEKVDGYEVNIFKEDESMRNSLRSHHEFDIEKEFIEEGLFFGKRTAYDIGYLTLEKNIYSVYFSDNCDPEILDYSYKVILGFYSLQIPPSKTYWGTMPTKKTNYAYAPKFDNSKFDIVKEELFKSIRDRKIISIIDDI